MPSAPPIRALLAGVVGTTASVLPAFMTGAVAVQLADGIGLTEGGLGLAMGGFFATAALGSAVLGRAAQRLGPSRAMRIGLGITVVTGVALSLARSPLQLGLFLLAGGASNALTQPAANLLLARLVPTHRLGLAMALKQAGMPLASLVGGAAVPALALTLGWPAAYAAAAGLAAAALVTVPLAAETDSPQRTNVPQPGQSPTVRTELATSLLLGYAAVGLLGAAAAGATVTFLVSGAEAAGTPEALAALLLTAGSAIGIGSRIAHGRWADVPGRRPIQRVALLLALGAAGALFLAMNAPWAYGVGVVPLFAFGWAWPGLFNLSVVRNNPTTAAAATGVTQTGVYIGAGAGPVLGGLVVTVSGYTALWGVVALLLCLAAAVAVGLSRRLVRRRAMRDATARQPDVAASPS